MEEKKMEELRKHITESGIRVDGIGILIKKFDELLLKLDQKIDKKLFFMEARQRSMEETQNKMLLALEKLISK